MHGSPTKQETQKKQLVEDNNSTLSHRKEQGTGASLGKVITSSEKARGGNVCVNKVVCWDFFFFFLVTQISLLGNKNCLAQPSGKQAMACDNVVVLTDLQSPLESFLVGQISWEGNLDNCIPFWRIYLQELPRNPFP